MRRIAAILLVLVAAAAAVVMTGARSEREEAGFKVKIAFDNAFGLTEGGDLRVGGVKAGKTLKFDVSKGKECQGATPGDGPPRACAIVESIITENGFKDFKSDAHCDIRQQSLIGEYYVDCQPGHNPKSLADNATIPDTQTTSTIPPDLVGDVLRRPYRDRLRLIIAELGTGLAGRPQDVSELLRKAHPGLRETQKVLQILGNQRTIIKNFISDSNTVVRELDFKKRELQNWIVQASRASDVSASRRAAIAAGFQRLPTFLSELDGTMQRLEDLTDAQTPVLQNLHRSAPALNTLFTRLGPFSEASRPAFRSLGRASDAGKKAFTDSREEIVALRQLAENAPETGKPLRQLLQTLDDRSRSTEDSSLAQATAPPDPDPTAMSKTKGHKGFTGMEAIFNYAYWQVLALNQFDQISHFLRAVVIRDSQCSVFQNDLKSTPEQRQIRDRCEGYLGPNQPGITTPDTPNDSTSANQTTPKRRATKPRAGETDWSKPHPTLPASQQDLLQHYGAPTQAPSSPGAPALPSAPAVPQSPADTTGPVSEVLDYLFAP
jgi:phospholipid/cholesterol/gamma-HCH transport system substrate-binding protein